MANLKGSKKKKRVLRSASEETREERTARRRRIRAGWQEECERRQARRERRLTFDVNAHVGIGDDALAGVSVESYMFLPDPERLAAAAPAMMQVLPDLIAKLYPQGTSFDADAFSAAVASGARHACQSTSTPPSESFTAGERVVVIKVGPGVVLDVDPGPELPHPSGAGHFHDPMYLVKLDSGRRFAGKSWALERESKVAAEA